MNRLERAKRITLCQPLPGLLRTSGSFDIGEAVDRFKICQFLLRGTERRAMLFLSNLNRHALVGRDRKRRLLRTFHGCEGWPDPIEHTWGAQHISGGYGSAVTAPTALPVVRRAGWTSAYKDQLFTRACG